MRLAYTGAVKEDVIDTEDAGLPFYRAAVQSITRRRSPERYKLEAPEDADGYELLQLAGKKRGYLVSGGEVNTERMAKALHGRLQKRQARQADARKPGGHTMKQEEPIDLWLYEREAFDAGIRLICGVDEAGRGPLAGPVCAAAVMLPPGLEIPGLNDSKKLTDKKRRELYDVITAQAVSYGIAFASEQEIDEINILQATFLAMERAMQKLSPQPELALIDGNRTKDFGLPVRTIVKGDSLSASIAAASILAKVTRDRLMEEYDAQYPQYGFAVHKGYGTKRHYEALREFGPSPIHRKTFLKKFYENP